MSQLAKKLRSDPTPAEKRVWRLLFPFRTDGFHFRKQVPIGHYVADIARHHAALIIEIDGDTHALPGAEAADMARTAYLEGEGYTVLRFSNRDVLENPEGVYATIEETLKHRQRNRQAANPS